MKLISFMDYNVGKTVLINPDHVSIITDDKNNTKIELSSGLITNVQHSFDAVVKAFKSVGVEIITS